jgi:deoxyribodipyrimidine photo-lyase
MWLASYVVHVRKVHWRCGADWLYGHLLDGDLASNHLSWQWVAGTGSRKPYLFNAENVARYAPASWHSAGSVIDTSYDVLDRLARQPAQQSHKEPVRPLVSPSLIEPHLGTEPPEELGLSAPDAAATTNRDVWLVHPWSLGEPPAGLPAGTVVIGVFPADFHRAWPWSERRWRFVGSRMGELAEVCWHGDAATIGAALQGARSVRSTAEPHLAPWLARWAACAPAPALFPPVEGRCDSFSQWWTRATRGLDSAADLLAVNEVPAL